MNTLPYLYQLQDVRSLHKMGGRALVSWDMGLGKCLLSLFFAYRHPHIRPMVVVCPASLKFVWESEAKKHFNMRAEVLEGYKPEAYSTRLAKSPLLIINYDILQPPCKKDETKKSPSWLEWLQSIHPQLIAIDETGSYLTNRSSKRTKAVRALCHGVPHVLALSGTPLMNRPAELWPTLNIVRPDLFPSFWPFAQDFCSPKRTRYGWDFSGSSNLDRLHKTLLQTCMVRRRKIDVLSELPSKQRTTLPIQLPPKDMREYEAARKDFIAWLAKTGAKKGKIRAATKAQAIVKLGYLKRMVGERKLPLVMEWIDSFLSQTDEKVIVFAVHKVVVGELEKRYRKCCVVVDGSTPGKVRQASVHQFQTDAKCRVFIGNIQAAGVGLTLTAANHVFFSEMGWTPGSMVQCEDRASRIGQTKNVNCYYMIAKGTIEEMLAKLIQKKMKTITQVLDGEAAEVDFDIFDKLMKEIRK